MTDQTGPNEAHIRSWLDTVFRHVDWSEGGIVSLLGIGEKGTPAEGVFRERQFVDPRSPFFVKSVLAHVRRWSEHGHASFIVPAVVEEEAAEDRNVRVDKIRALTAICCDIDSGDTTAKRDHAIAHLGQPSMEVYSGGRTAEDHPKRHLFWLLSEPSTEVDRVAHLRKVLANKIGGDASFMRATQVIRLAGSIYGKAGAKVPVTCDVWPENEYHLDDIADTIEAMPAMPGLPAPAPKAEPVAGLMDFSAFAGQSAGSHALDAMQRDIHEGGTEDRNRWSEFSSVAGHHIHQVRLGLEDLETAYSNVAGWTLAHMIPPWPEQRIRAEFTAVLKHDMERRGPLSEMPKPGAGVAVTPIAQVDSTDALLGWAVHKRSTVGKVERRLLVDGLIFCAKRHMLVAEGGAGKTFLCMDLALKLAASGPERHLTWLGQGIAPNAHGGTVILMTGEDDLEELDHRWNALDPDGALRRAAGDRLIALPLDNLGGAFPLVSLHPATREPIASPRWAALFAAMQGIHANDGRVSAVIIDTLNSTLHGEENSAAVIGEYVRAVAPICGELGAALVVTHHVRKPGDEPIKTLDDMRAAIRGSTALPNAMRLVMGVWHAHDYERRMKAMGMQPQRGAMYSAGVVKANMPEAMRAVKTLLRTESGQLADATRQEVSSRGSNHHRLKWLTWAIEHYAERYNFFFAATGKNGVFSLKEMFPPILRSLTRTEIDDLVEEAIEKEYLLKRKVYDSGSNQMDRLDLPEYADKHRQHNGARVPRVKFADWFYNDAEDRIMPVSEGWTELNL